MATGRPSGRPAKPVESHRIAGNPSKKKLPNAPMPGKGLSSATDIPTPPDDLYDDGLALWDYIWTAGKQWLSPDSDHLIIKRLCEAEDEYQQIRRALWDGTVRRYYEVSNGQLVSHPLIGQYEKLRVQMTSWMAAIGFSPSDRARLGLAEVRVRDELDELAQRRAQRATGA